MATYNSLNNVSIGVIPAEKIGAPPCVGTLNFAEQTVGPTTTNVVREYDPVSSRQWKDDPTKGYRRDWSGIKASGTISMTRYSVGKQTTRNHVVSRDYAKMLWERRGAYCVTDKSCHSYGIREAIGRWTQNDHLGSLSNVPVANPVAVAEEDFQSQVTDAIHSTQNAAFAESLSSFDVLTQIAEGEETLSFLSGKVKDAANALNKLAHEDEFTWKRARGLNSKQLAKSTDKALRRLGSRWMEYRYAIMPIVYSIRDINELLGKRTEVYKTSRSRESIVVSLEAPPELPTLCIYNTGDWNAQVRSTVKTAYNRGALQRILSQSSFNPFRTAWELIPYSFVIDWFINVGDVITSQTSLDLSSQKVCCTAVKKTITTQTYLHDFTDHSQFQSWASTVCSSATERQFRRVMTTNGLLQEVMVESYDRFLWQKPQPKLTFDPFLNWKRFLDSLVLGYQPTKNLLRSL